MNNNPSKLISKISFYGCWAVIILISFNYAVSSTSPWIARDYNIIDPKIHLDTEYYALPQKMYGNQQIGLPPNEFLIEKATNFYSGVGTKFYSEVFYRPDFEQFPVETSLILIFRLLTFAGIVLFFFLLSKILRSVIIENPFDEKNHLRLFSMGLIAVFLPIVRTLHSTVLAGYVQYDPKLLGYEITPSYSSLWLVLFGILIVILSFFFRETAQIYEEQKLTV